MGGENDNKNLILAAVLSMLVVFAWQAFVVPPPPPPPEPTAVEGQADVPAATVEGGTVPTPTTVAEGGLDRDEALAKAPRVKIETGALSGSIALAGGRLDDLHLLKYRDTLKSGSDTVVLLNPAGGPNPYFVDYGWRRTVDNDPGPLPNQKTEWRVESGNTLTASSPVVLRWDNGQGLIFRRTFALDKDYMFTVTQSVENTTEAAVSLAPYGAIARRGEPDGVGFYILHEGAVGVFDGELSEVDYDEIRDLPVGSAERGPVETLPVADNGWLGFTDKYWMSTLIPEPGQAFDAVYRLLNLGGIEEFRTEMRLPVISIGAGATAESKSRLFSGAKELETLSGLSWPGWMTSVGAVISEIRASTSRRDTSSVCMSERDASRNDCRIQGISVCSRRNAVAAATTSAGTRSASTQHSSSISLVKPSTPISLSGWAATKSILTASLSELCQR